MKEIFSEKKAIIINILVLICIFLFLSYSWRYAIVKNDDIIDYIINPFQFWHWLYSGEIFSMFLIVGIPNILGIHIQDFAFFSEGIIKALSLVFVIYFITKSYFKFNEKNYVLPVLSIITTLFIFTALYFLNFTISIEVMAFYLRYLFSFLFYLLFWYKIEEFYIKNKNCEKKDILNFIVLSFFILTFSNELFILSVFILLFLILVENIIKNFNKIKEIPIWTYFPFLIYSLLGLIVLILSMIFNYNITDHNSIFVDLPTKKVILDFFLVFFYRVIIENNIILVISLFCLILLFITRKRNEYNYNVFKFVIYSYLSFISFYSLLIFMGETFTYPISTPPHYENMINAKYWIQYPAVLLPFKLFLYTSILYMTGCIKKTLPKCSNFVTACIVTGVLIWFFSFDLINDYHIYPRQKKQDAYLMDKISIFYLESKKTIVISPDLSLSIMSDNLIPNLKNEDDYNKKFLFFDSKYSKSENPNLSKKHTKINKIFFTDKTNERNKRTEMINKILMKKTQNYQIKLLRKKLRLRLWPYLAYLDIIYGADINSGFLYVHDIYDAIEIYKQNGGIIEKEELDILKFSNIKYDK